MIKDMWFEGLLSGRPLQQGCLSLIGYVQLQSICNDVDPPPALVFQVPRPYASDYL
jgi:hypothetical protein